MRVIEVIRRGRRGADGQSNIVGVTTVTGDRLMSNDDSGKAFRVTATATLTIPAVVSDGWSIIVDADGADATLTSSSNLNGAGSDIVISDGNAALIYSSGSEHFVRFYVADAITTINATGVAFTPITGNSATTVAGAIGVLTGLWNNVTTYGKSLIAAVDAAAARAVLGVPDVIDEDDMATDSATRPPSQQSTKAYVDGLAIGVDQTWQDVSGSRAANTSYQNTTGKTIAVSIRPDALGAGRKLEVSVDNSTWVTLMSSGTNESYGVFGLVPPDNYYRYTGGFAIWAELR